MLMNSSKRKKGFFPQSELVMRRSVKTGDRNSTAQGFASRASEASLHVAYCSQNFKKKRKPFPIFSKIAKALTTADARIILDKKNGISEIACPGVFW
jgi:hypothetical protein